MPSLLALDLARVTGWAVITTAPGRAPTVEASGAVTVHAGKWANDWSRANKEAWAVEQLATWLYATINRWGVYAIVLEEPFLRPDRTHVARQLWLLRGAAMAAGRLARPHLAIIDAPIRAWQTWAAGELGWHKLKGRAGDQADARAIGLWAASIMQHSGENR